MSNAPINEPTKPSGSDVPTCSRVPTQEDAPIADSSWDFEDGDDYDDDCVDEDTDDCGLFPRDGVWACMQIGSEPCEFCPNRPLIGTNADEDDDDDSENDEMTRRQK